jgi:hypothetical protein
MFGFKEILIGLELDGKPVESKKRDLGQSQFLLSFCLIYQKQFC